MNTSLACMMLVLVSLMVIGAVLAKEEWRAVREAPRFNPAIMPSPEPFTLAPDEATAMQLIHEAQAHYLRTRDPQDLARVKTMRADWANRGGARG